MFLLTYPRRELRRRLRQTVLVSLGLAVGVGLVITVTAVSRGVRDAQDTALTNLYGVGTDITVTVAADCPGDQTVARPLLQKLQSGTLAPGESIRGDSWSATAPRRACRATGSAGWARRRSPGSGGCPVCWRRPAA
jgi:hypothetical protein